MKKILELIKRYTIRLYNKNQLLKIENKKLLADKEILEKQLSLYGVGFSLPDLKKEGLIDYAYTLNLQNLSGREDFEEAFRLGIMTGVDELIEYLNE